MERKNKERPPCPDCNSFNIMSKGYMWRCNICGRWFLKIYHPRKLLRNLEHPVCPICFNGDNAISKGSGWLCRKCGSWWTKIRVIKEKPIFDLREVIKG